MRISFAKRVGLVALAATTTLALSACGGGEKKTAEAKKETVIKAAVAYAGDNFHPSSTSSALALGANLHVVEGLYELDMHNFKAYKGLASADEPEKVNDTTYKVSLRKDAKFSDGKAVTADDVVKSFERSMADGNIYQPMVSFIDKVEKADDTSVKITLKHPFSLLKQRLALVKIVPAAMSDEELTKKPTGTGPWKYDSISEEKVTFVPNENYNGEHPAKAARMEWSVLKDDTARITAMTDGTVDVMENVPAANVSQVEGTGAKVEKVDGFGLPFLMFNTKKAPFDNAKVRQAFFYAIDTEKLIKNAMAGEAKPVTSFLPENHANYHKAKNVYTYDTEKAKNLLKEAGAEGTKLTLLTTDHPWVQGLSAQIKNDLEAAGLKVEIKSEATKSLYPNHTDTDNPDFDVVLAPGDPSVFGNDPDLLMSWWYGDNSWTQKRTQWKGSAGYEKLHALMSEAVTLEGEAQQQKWNECFDLLSEEVPLYPLFHRSISTAYQESKLDGYKPIGTTGLDFIGVAAK